jgi:hypothetical protein
MMLLGFSGPAHQPSTAPASPVVASFASPPPSVEEMSDITRETDMAIARERDSMRQRVESLDPQIEDLNLASLRTTQQVIAMMLPRNGALDHLHKG